MATLASVNLIWFV